MPDQPPAKSALLGLPRDPESLWSRDGLTIVGTGIRAGLQTTPESVAAIRRASKVLYLVADVLAQLWIQDLNTNTESLQRLYREDTRRLEIYNDIVEYILAQLRAHKDLCVVFYSHPGCFVYPAYEAIRLARAEGFPARRYPGVSAAENLYADLASIRDSTESKVMKRRTLCFAGIRSILPSASFSGRLGSSDTRIGTQVISRRQIGSASSSNTCRRFTTSITRSSCMEPPKRRLEKLRS
ncbi:hypothetical protein F0Q45_13490 [Mycobacterium simiae]|uniref:Tetrapyrrole methylase domain-containing protein n=1 Tax=Mycobacterium simiae TaxID=1784 RepID=A0A5B1BR80_MYCSI|nr:hypothetical protein F0Q45_13490 [Mycobacterium simiae]